jgi:hypothetical protein
MGAWGTAIFSDDFAGDIRGDYTGKLAIGKTNAEAMEEIMKEHYTEVKGTEDEPVFWFALAYVQWQKGRLEGHVKEMAIKFIDGGEDLERWNFAGNEKNYKKRVKVLQDLKKTLLSPMPPEKKVRIPPWIWTCPWEVGDLLAYKITSSTVKRKDYDSVYAGKFILLRLLKVMPHIAQGIKTDRAFVGLYGWIGDEVPNASIADKLEYILIDEGEIQFLGKYHERFAWVRFTKKEIKEHEIQKIGIDASYKENLPEFFDGHNYSLTAYPSYDYIFNFALGKYFSTKNPG